MAQRYLIIGFLFALGACSTTTGATPSIDLDKLDQLEVASVQAWAGMNDQQRTESCNGLATMGRDGYQRILQQSMINAGTGDPGLAAYAFAEMLEAHC